MRDWELVRREQVNASRLVRQLEQLLYEMDTLRAQVQDSDIAKFDKLTTNARDSTVAAIKEYLELRFQLPSSTQEASPKDEEEDCVELQEQRQVQLRVQEEDTERQQACLHAWNLLQQDLHQLHQLFVDFNRIIHEQRERVDKVEDDVAETQLNVHSGVNYLEKASRYRAAAYPIAGALIGTCLGGPVGLFAGLKLGGLTALGGGLLGFTGATLLKKRQLENLQIIKNDDEKNISPGDSLANLTRTVESSTNSKKRL